MSQLDPSNTTVGDLCSAALQDSGRVGTGQTALAEDLQRAQRHLQWMLQEWERKRWLVYHLRTYTLVATGATSYTFGPGGQFDTNQFPVWQLGAVAPVLGLGGAPLGGSGYHVGDTITLGAKLPSGAPLTPLVVTVATVSGSAVATVTVTSGGAYPGPLPNHWTQLSTSGGGTNAEFGYATWSLATATTTVPGGTVRPARIESGFTRQIQFSTPNQVDWPYDVLQSQEDYNRIALKNLQSFPGAVFLDTAWPLSQVYLYPVPQASIYSINLSVREQLPASFVSAATTLNLPFEYYNAINLNLALRLRTSYGISTFPGDKLEGLAKDSLNALRTTNAQIARLQMPKRVLRSNGIYNIFSDQSY